MNPATSAVVVVATILVKADEQAAALAAITAAIEATHDESGCLAYALHRDLDDPARFVMVEKWETAEALAEHATTPHLKTLFAALGPLLAEPPTIIRSAAVPVGDPAKGTV